MSAITVAVLRLQTVVVLVVIQQQQQQLLLQQLQQYYCVVDTVHCQRLSELSERYNSCHAKTADCSTV